MEIKVLTMNCNHCVNRIKTALLEKGIESTFDLENQLVYVTKEVDLAKEIITQLGYKIA